MTAAAMTATTADQPVDHTDGYVAPTWAEAILPRRSATYVAVVAGLAAATAATLSLRAGAAALAPLLVAFSACSAVIAAGDAVTRHIPNKCNAAALASAVPLLLLARAAGYGSLAGAACGAVAAFALYFALWLVSPAGMGLGDVKFAPHLGAHLGFFGFACWTDGIITGFLVQGVVVIVALLARRAGRKAHIAHGPAMAAGAAIALFSVLPLA